MGYDIRYTLTCPEEGPDVEAVAEMMATIADNNHPGEPGYENATQCWTDVLRGSQFITWYNCQQHMEQVSSEHPGKLFQLELAGENADFDDLWTFYFRDGMVQEARGHVTYPEFDPGLLLPVRQKELDITTHPINEANMALEEAECNRRTGQAA